MLYSDCRPQNSRRSTVLAAPNPALLKVSTVNGSRKVTARAEPVMPPPAAAPAVRVAAKQNPGKRRSTAVQEVEKLKENRDKRRAQQADQEKLKSRDRGSPNWDFLQMIEEFK